MGNCLSDPRASLPPFDLSERKVGETIVLSAEYCRYRDGRHMHDKTKKVPFLVEEKKKTAEKIIGPMCTECSEMLDKSNDGRMRVLDYKGTGHMGAGMAG